MESQSHYFIVITYIESFDDSETVDFKKMYGMRVVS